MCVMHTLLLADIAETLRYLLAGSGEITLENIEVHIQWILSNSDTLGTEESVPISEVS